MNKLDSVRGEERNFEHFIDFMARMLEKYVDQLDDIQTQEIHNNEIIKAG